VDHQVQVMYSGHLAILDTIHVSGQISDGFTIGLPYQYSADVLKVFAYDSSHVYDVNLGVQMGNHSGFYGATVSFDGNNPSVFTVAFVLSNSLLTEQGTSQYILSFPAYPSLTQSVGTCHANITFPSQTTSLTITKPDGQTKGATYTKTDLPAYTYSASTADFKVPSGSIQLTSITNLNREVTIDATGAVTVTDSYRIVANSTSPLNSFVLSLPQNAANAVVKDQFDNDLSTQYTKTSNALLANATFVSFVNQGQATVLTAYYTLPSAQIQAPNYVLNNFKLFPNFQYLVEQASTAFNLPEGATVITPQASTLTSSSTLLRGTYQDTLSVTANDVSYVDYLAPQQNLIRLSYNYNPVWVSFRPTFWAALAAFIGCVGAVVYRKVRPKEETYQTRAEAHVRQAMAQKGAVYEVKPGQQASPEIIKEFVDAYENRIQLKAELHSMDLKAQKGKIPRRQYKVQRKNVEIRIEGLNRSIERSKAFLGGTSGSYPDLVRQLDLAESDLAESELNIEKLESLYGKGEISRESYKQRIVDYQKVHDKAESAIKGILLRLREKIR
ncbi:MAG: hypothetical protein ACQCN6_14740, partial [Candidatus Bathyarchaeia archaeon]